MKTESVIKKVAAIHDISGFGRASLTVIIPILSTMGIQVCPVPTAVLSTHSGGFAEYSFTDLTDGIPDYINHWKKLGINFDVIYSGFLGSSKQIDLVIDIVKNFKTQDNWIVVDPVMGDNNMLYSSVKADMIPEMNKLISVADIIIPNYTEARFLLGADNTVSLSDGKEWLKKLSAAGPRIVMITSFPSGKKNVVNTLIYNREKEEFWCIPSNLFPVSYPGTGDLFASVMIGNMLKGDMLPEATEKASRFVYNCIEESEKYDYPARDGVLLEKMLPQLNKEYADLSYYSI